MIWTPDVGNAIGVLTSLGAYTPLGAHSEETVTNVALAEDDFTVPRPDRATGILVQPVTGGIQFTLDGTDPTVTPGFVIPTGNLPLYIPLNDENTLTVVREAAVDSSLRCQWVRVEN